MLVEFDLVPWLLAATACLAIGGLLAALVAVARLAPLVARADDDAHDGQRARRGGPPRSDP
jgi:hypothetical protein